MLAGACLDVPGVFDYNPGLGKMELYYHLDSFSQMLGEPDQDRGVPVKTFDWSYSSSRRRPRRVIGRRFTHLAPWLLALVLVAPLSVSCGGKGKSPTEASRYPGRTPPAISTATVTPAGSVTAIDVEVPETATVVVPSGTPLVTLPVNTPQEVIQTETVIPAQPTTVEPTATPLQSSATPTLVPTRPSRMPSPGYGMQAFLWWRPEVAQRDLEMIRDADFGWVKQGFAWREIEGSGKGQFDWSVTDRIVQQVEEVGGLRLIVRLDSDPTWSSGRSYPNPQDIIMSPPSNLQDYADFCYAVASRYRGRIAAYQIWNEPNLSREWGGRAPDPAAYAAMLQVGYEAIKRADPAATVISAGLAPTTRFDQVAMPDTEFVRRMYAAGAQPYFDALGAHGAGYKSPPEKDPGEVANDADYYNRGDPNCPGDACRIYCFRHVEDLHQIMVNNGDVDKQVVVLEFGWTKDPRPDSPYHWHAVSEELQADYLVGAYQYAKEHWRGWIGVMSLIYMPNIDWTEADEQYWWSVAVPNYPQFYPYKAYRDLAAMPK